jgi:N-acetylmuramoyl-L-alanine amidase
MWIGNPQGKINGKPYKIPDGVPPKIVKNRTFVPVRFVAEGLGAVVNWNPKDAQIGSGAVTVYYPK